jgi:hypothetical protein
MSLAIKEQFKKCVTAQHAAYLSHLALDAPVFEDDGFLTIALMAGRGGKVELWCGPAEYHVELFIHDDNKSKQLTLRDLVALSPVREWMQWNRASMEGKQRVEAEIEYAFRLLAHGVSRVPEMNWLLHHSPPSPSRG